MKAIVFPFNNSRESSGKAWSTGKTAEAKENIERGKSWFVLADSTVSNTGKPFYLPDELGACSAHLALVVKISRLGKGISPKFGERYFKEIAPAVLFSLPEFEKRLKDSGLSLDAARNFDRALMVGEFEEFNILKHASLKLNEEAKAEFSIGDLSWPIEDLISDFSQFNTVKMGDYIIAGISGNIDLKQDDILHVEFNDRHSFSVRIK